MLRGEREGWHSEGGQTLGRRPLGGEGQKRLSRSLRGWRELAQAGRMATRTVGRESQCAIDLRSQGHVPL